MGHLLWFCLRAGSNPPRCCYVISFILDARQSQKFVTNTMIFSDFFHQISLGVFHHFLWCLKLVDVDLKKKFSLQVSECGGDVDSCMFPRDQRPLGTLGGCPDGFRGCELLLLVTKLYLQQDVSHRTCVEGQCTGKTFLLINVSQGFQVPQLKF